MTVPLPAPVVQPAPSPEMLARFAAPKPGLIKNSLPLPTTQATDTSHNIFAPPVRESTVPTQSTVPQINAPSNNIMRALMGGTSTPEPEKKVGLSSLLNIAPKEPDKAANFLSYILSQANIDKK